MPSALITFDDAVGRRLDALVAYNKDVRAAGSVLPRSVIEESSRILEERGVNAANAFLKGEFQRLAPATSRTALLVQLAMRGLEAMEAEVAANPPPVSKPKRGGRQVVHTTRTK
jgi:hypothetical protein